MRKTLGEWIMQARLLPGEDSCQFLANQFGEATAVQAAVVRYDKDDSGYINRRQLIALCGSSIVFMVSEFQPGKKLQVAGASLHCRIYPLKHVAAILIDQDYRSDGYALNKKAPDKWIIRFSSGSGLDDLDITPPDPYADAEGKWQSFRSALCERLLA